MQIKNTLNRGLIVSCQAEENEPLYGSKNMALLAYAAESSGAVAIRALTPEDVCEIKNKVKIPVIGLTKDRKSKGAFITIYKRDIDALAKAGSDFIALDCTERERPEPIDSLFSHIRNNYPYIGIIADIADINDVKKIKDLNPDFISTTLSGYTDYTKDIKKPDIELISKIKEITDIPVIAEGNYIYPQQARQAVINGAYSVVVGGAITRPQKITTRFNNAIKDITDDFYSLGLDIGGTHTRIVKTNRKGEITASETTETGKTKEKIIETVFHLTDKYIDSKTKYIGIATAGRVFRSTGIISFASKNLPEWTGTDLKTITENRYNISCTVGNDADLAAYSQYLKVKKDILYITVGTGIGGGIISDGQILNGKKGNAGEIGHIIYPGNKNMCSCGKTGCIETIVSGKNLLKNLEADPKNRSNVFKDYSEKIAWLIDTVKNTCDFEEVYIGGVLPKYGEDLLRMIQENYYAISEENTEKIYYSEVGELAGAYGASLYSFYNWEENYDF
ncbi:MAG: putative N-acetylmannosamine-6-phosphate 2-epimerase [Thermotogae bacterium]|nr:putative N-acetylmannosamine-6-phosphate 2-epimerase [Thermotogota bacterium]